MGDLEVDIKEIKEYNPDEDGYIHIDISKFCSVKVNIKNVTAEQFTNELVIMLKDYNVNKSRDVIEIDYCSNQIIKKVNN